ncbi:MAG: cyclic nucleotide-binding domain-containing protein [Rikenellaceae bacterium]|jgi:CRP-like cAMP-binding protein|nr:cyclic nucleotide-binding domain-containing protein [Rikenellaceae bacterium]
MKTGNISEILTACPLFRGMGREQIDEILADKGNYIVSQYNTGDVIARRETTYSGLMIILAGSARGETTEPSGKVARLESLESPQLIAPAFLFGGYNRLPVDVVAESDVTIITLHRGFIFELMQQHMLVLSNFIDILSDRANVWSKRIYFLSFQSLRQKVASFLTESGRDLTPMPDIAHVAEVFGATHQAVRTVFDVLVRKKIIAIEGDQIAILNRAALEAILK